jgi:signal transduction histidine kinase
LLAVLTRRIGWTREQASLPTETRTIMARAGGWLFVAGGTVGLVSLAAPGGVDRNEHAILAIALVAYALGLLELGLLERLPAWTFPILTAAGTGLVSVAVYYGGTSSSFYRLLYFWVVLYAAYFFSLVHATVHATIIAAAYALVLSFDRTGGGELVGWFLLSATLAVAAGLVVALRTRLERLLAGERQQVERLRELDRLKDEIIATVSHELRTPLAAVYGAALTLKERELAEDQRAELLEIVHRESGRLARFVNDVLLASHLDSGRVHAEISRCQPRELVDDVVTAARAHVPPNVTIAVRAPDAVAPVAADADQLGQVLANLVDNAVKYSPEGGRVELALEPENGRVRFSVRDEGLGVPPDEQERIFEKFHRLDPNLVRGVPGTGLGLYIARELVRRMHGDIRVSSSPGAGSEFSFELPVAVAAEEDRKGP